MSEYRIDLCTGFVKIGEAVAFTFAGTMADLGAGTWTLSAPSQGIADTNPEAVDSIVVRDSDTGAVVYSGAIRQGSNDARFVRTVDKAGYRYQWEGTDLYGMLSSRISYPTPSTTAPWADAYDTNTGPASTVAANYLNDNYGPGALAARQVTGVTITNPAIGSTLTWEARLLNLANLIGDICRAGGVTIDAIWDDTTSLAYTFRTPTDLSGSIILSDQGDLESATITKASPTTFIVGAGQGELVDRTFRTAGTGATGFARVEALYDNTNIVNGTTMQTAVDARLAELNGLFRVDAVVAPDAPNLPAWRTDYLLGDLLGVQIDGVRYAAPVTSVRFNITADRQIVYPVLGGSPGNDLTSLIRKVDGVAASIENATIERIPPASRPVSVGQSVGLSKASATITTTRSALTGTVTVVSVPYARRVFVNALVLADATGTSDLYLMLDGAPVSRARHATGNTDSVTVSYSFDLAANTAADVSCSIAAASGSHTWATAGGSDLNRIDVLASPS